MLFCPRSPALPYARPQVVVYGDGNQLNDANVPRGRGRAEGTPRYTAWLGLVRAVRCECCETVQSVEYARLKAQNQVFLKK